MPAVDTKPLLDTQSTTAWSALESRVEGVKRKNRIKFLSTGVCLGLAVFVAAFLVFSAADIVFKLSVGSRFFVLISTFLGIAAVFFWSVVRPWMRLGGSVQVARSVEDTFPQLEEQLSTALEYSRDSRLAITTSSPALVGALVQQAALRSAPLDFGRTIRWKQLGIAGALAFLLAIGLTAYARANHRLFSITFLRFLQPSAAIAPPTLTVIDDVKPGDDEQAVESSVEIKADIGGKLPDTATLSVWIGDEKDGRWEDRVMDRDSGGGNNENATYRATLRRLLESTKYRISANDAESREFHIDVYKLPEINEFAVRLEYPSYTGRAPDMLAPGSGDVRALKGTKVHLDVKANTELGAARVSFKSGQADIAGGMDATDKRKASLDFTVEHDDEYQVHIENVKHKPGAGSLYQIKALKDYPPKVTIRKPEKDLMVHLNQTVQVEIDAQDDVGLSEIGLFHSLGLEEKQVMIKRLSPAANHAEGKLVWELGNMGLKGGEVITYYAYALDNDTVGGPKSKQWPNGGKMAKSDIHFLTVYDEQDYDSPQSPQKMKGTPPAVKQLDKLIDLQKKLLKETFGQARQRDASEKPISDSEKTASLKTAEAQKGLREKVQDLVAKVKTELAKADEEPAPAEKGKGTGTDPHPQAPAFGEKELKHLEAAIDRMAHSESELKKPDATLAVPPESEALRHMSETRRLLLSDKEGDPRFKMAMDKQSKKKKKDEQEQQQQDQEQAKQELAEMPKMMERQKKIERELEELSERKKKSAAQPKEPQTPEQKEEKEQKRSLDRKNQDELEQMAKEAKERARTLDRLAERNPDMQPAADKMQEAAEKLEQAAKEAQKEAEKNAKEAKDKTHQAQNDTKEAHRSLRNAMEKQVRQELANLQKDAQDLAQRQQDLAQQTAQIQKEQPGQKEQQGQKEQPGQKEQQGQKSQAQQGKPESGQPEQGQPQQGKPESGQAEQGQPQPGQPQQGKPESQAAQGKPQPNGNDKDKSQQAQMRGMAGEQRDIQNDLKELSDRMEGVAARAAEKQLAGAKELDKARQQASESSPAGQAAQKSRDALNAAKPDEAQRESAKSAKAMEQLAHAINEAAHQTSAGDMKELAGAMKKLKELAKEQGDINKDIAKNAEPGRLGEREENVSGAAKDLAKTAENLEVLQQSGTDGSAKDKLNDAAEQAEESAKALKGQDNAAAKAPAEKADKALNQALNDMERAAGKTLEEKAREAMNMAKETRTEQEKATAAAKEITPPAPGEKMDPASEGKRDEAAAKENQAARDARRLDHALEGLQELAKDVNPAAAEAAKDARDLTQQAELPKSMEDLAKGMEKIGDPKSAENKTNSEKAPSPREAAEKGQQLAHVVHNVEKSLDAYVAEAKNSQLDRLRAMEAEAREAAKKAQDLAKNTENNADKSTDKNTSKESKPASPDKSANTDKNNPDSKTDPKSAEKNSENKPDPSQAETPAKGDKPGSQSAQSGSKPGDPSEQNDPKQDAEKQTEEVAKQLDQALKRLQPKLERLEPNAPELVKMREARAAFQKGQEASNQKPDPKAPPSPGGSNSGGPSYERSSQALDQVTSGLVNRIERILRAREVKPEEDENAPAEYRALVDKYYRALSEDVEEDKHN